MSGTAGRLLLAAFFCISATIASAGTPAAAGKMLFTKPVALRGTLGEAQVQMNLRVKADYEDGVEGNYFIFGQSQQILLAGEIEGDELALEESVNGTDVSGQWNGKLDGEVLTGEWQSADGTLSKSFRLNIVRPAAGAAKAGTSSRQAKQ